jgi:hypothetical protein
MIAGFHANAIDDHIGYLAPEASRRKSEPDRDEAYKQNEVSDNSRDTSGFCHMIFRYPVNGWNNISCFLKIRLGFPKPYFPFHLILN